MSMRRATDTKMAPLNPKLQKGSTFITNTRKSAGTSDQFGGWDTEDEIDDLSIEDWAKNKYANDSTNLRENIAVRAGRAPQSRQWEKFLCTPSIKCTGIKDIEDFKGNSLSEWILKENKTKNKVENNVKEDADGVCNNCERNRGKVTRVATQITLRPSNIENPSLPNRAKSSNNLSFRSRSKLGLVYKKYVDEDEDEDALRTENSSKPPLGAKFIAISSSGSSSAQDTVSRAQSCASFNTISESPEINKTREIKSANVQRSVISPAVKLCYTTGVDPARASKGSVVGTIRRSKTLSDLQSDSIKTYDRSKSTSSDGSQDKTFVTNLKSKFTRANQSRGKQNIGDNQGDTRNSSRNQSVRKHMSKLAKQRRQEQAAKSAKNDQDATPIAMVLRRYANESETEIDARLRRVQGIESKIKRAQPKSEHSNEKQNGGPVHPTAGSPSEENPRGRNGESVTVRFVPSGDEGEENCSDNPGKDGIFPIGEILPDPSTCTPKEPTVVPNGVKFHPYKYSNVEMDRDMKVTGRDLLVHHEEGIILLREGTDMLRIHDRFGHQSHLGPPGFRPMSQKTPLHRARDSTQKRMSGKTYFPHQDVEDPTALLRLRMPKLSNFSLDAAKRVQSAAPNEASNGFGGRLSRRRRLGDQAQDRTTMIDFQHARAKLQMGVGDVLRRYQSQEDA